jgi:SPP1 family predicted phage head-tail adaptor
MGNLGHYLDPGELDRKVTIQTASGVQDAYGEEINTWLDTLDVWAKMEWGTGVEGMDANQVVSTDKVKFTIRYTTVDAKDRIKYEDKYYDIETIQEVGGRKRFLILTTKIFDSNANY